MLPNDEPLSRAEETVWRESGADDLHIKIIATHGGYAGIRFNTDKELALQDILDHLMQQRIINVRNALRTLGWNGERFADLTKEIGGRRFILRHDTRRVGAGQNVVGHSFVIREQSADMDAPRLSIPDEMTATAQTLAGELERHARLEFKLEAVVRQPGKLFTRVSSGHIDTTPIHEAIPDSDGRYGAAFRDALDATILALLHRGVNEHLLNDALVEVLDAYGNNMKPKDDEPVVPKNYVALLEWSIKQIAAEARTGLEGRRRFGDPFEGPSPLQRIRDMADNAVSRIVGAAAPLGEVEDSVEPGSGL